MKLLIRPNSSLLVFSLFVNFICIKAIAQCPEFTSSVFNGNCGSPCVVCINEDISLGVAGINIPNGTCVNWYYSTTPGFNPYNGEGTFINCSTINGPGLSYTTLHTTEDLCGLTHIYVVGILDPGTLAGCPQIFTTEFSFSLECITANAEIGGLHCVSADIYLHASGGVSYNWSGPNGFSANVADITIQNVQDVNKGTYYVTVTGQNGCTDVASYYEELYPGIEIWTDFTDWPYKICANSQDSIWAYVVNPGSGSYEVFGWAWAWWNNSIFSTDWKIVPQWDGYYHFQINDILSGCWAPIDFEVVHIPAPDVVITPKSANICPGGDLELIATAFGGVAPYAYEWSTGEYANSIHVSDPGIYQVTVTDANGCTDSTAVVISQGNPIMVSIEPFSTNICAGSDNNIIALAKGGIEPYSFNWDTPFGPFNGADINANIPGDYKVTVTDIIGCTGTAKITTKLNPNIVISVLPDSVYSCNNTPVNITATASGGSGSNYQYKWNSPSGQILNGSVINTTEKGHYSLTVTDGVGCTKEAGATVFSISELTVLINPAPASFCPGDSIILNSVVPGGTANYTYLWSSPSGNYNTANITANTFGLYQLTVTDENGCSGNKSINVTQKDSIKVNILPASANFCIGDSVILIATTADTGILNYTWTNGVEVYNGDTIIVNKSGNYVVNVSSNIGCPGKDSILVKEIPKPEINITPNPAVFCTGSSITLLATTKDTGIISYNWNTPSGSFNTKSITANKAGQYIVNISNFYGCLGSDTIDVVQNDTLAVIISPDPASFCLGHSVKLTAATTASGILNYNWSTPNGTASGSEITAGVAGNYIVTVTNNNGCSGTAFVNVTESQGLTVTIDPGNAGFCTGNSVNLTANTTGSKLSYLWKLPSGASASTQTINTNKSGFYSVTVTDEGGCTGTATIEVQEYAGLDIKIDPDPASFCNTGSVELTALNSNGVAPFTYEWNTPVGSASTNTFTANTIGSYTVTVTDVNGCTGTATTQVSQSNSLSLSFIPSNLGFCPGKTTDLEVKANGGQQPYTYSWNTPLGSYSSNSINTNTAGAYLVTVTDVNGCSGTADVEIKAFTTPVIDLAADLGFCPGSAVKIKPIVTDLKTPLVYTWITPSGSSTLDSLIVNTPGNYSVTVSNAVGCSTVANTSVEKWDIPYIKYSPFPVEFCKGQSVEVKAGATIGLAPFSYYWQGPTNTYTGSPLSITEAGKYYLTVIDSHACTSSTSLTATELPDLVVSLNTDPDVLCGVTPFTILSKVNGGSVPYNYNWITPTGNEQSANIISNDFGDFTLTVTDSKACSGTAILTVKADSLSVVLDKTDPGCIALKAGSITLLSASNPSFPMQLVLNNNPPVIINSLPYLLNTLSAGIYHIDITGKNGCKQTLNLELSEPSIPELKLGDDVTIYLGETFTIIPVASFIIDSIKWSNKSSLNCSPGCLEPVASPKVNTTYKATAYSKDGCKAVDDINVYIVEKESVYVPNSFSPNGDGINDKFVIYTDQSVKQIKKLGIYDRWGESVYVGENFPPNDPDYGWNGKFREQFMNTAVFVYYLQVEFNDGRVKEFKGDINLMR